MKIANQLLLTFVINACWQIALIALFVALSGRLLQQSTARVKHALWVSGLLLCVAVPMLTSVASAIQLPVWGATPKQESIGELAELHRIDQTGAGITQLGRRKGVYYERPVQRLG